MINMQLLDGVLREQAAKKLTVPCTAGTMIYGMLDGGALLGCASFYLEADYGELSDLWSQNVPGLETDAACVKGALNVMELSGLKKAKYFGDRHRALLLKLGFQAGEEEGLILHLEGYFAHSCTCKSE